MDWKRVIDNSITHASRTIENRYQQSFISLLSTSMFSLETFKYCIVTFMVVVGWFDALSDEVLTCSKYDSLGLEFGIMI